VSSSGFKGVGEYRRIILASRTRSSISESRDEHFLFPSSDLSQVGQVSQGDKLAVDRGNPFSFWVTTAAG
jgi:hypothetical protein